MTSPITRDTCAALDAADTLAPLRDQFDLPEGVIYLDGNSLGVLPRATAGRVQDVIRREWGQDLIQSWNKAGWIDYPQRVGDKIARLVGGRPGEVIAADSTSLNLYKVLSVALASVRAADPDGQRRVIVSERDNFPTDLYIAESLARQHGFTLRLVETDEIAAQLAGAAGDELAVLMLTHVNYRTGRQHAMAEVTAAAHAAGALVVWDLAHSAGAVPVDLNGCDADFAIGCGYKYLNGGPGAPAFVWVNTRHAGQFEQPLSGWWGHAAPFEFTPNYRPAPGVGRYLCGTQPIVALAGLECGLDTVLAAEVFNGDFGPMAALRSKSLALTDAFIALVEQRCADRFTLVTPRDHALRGSQVCLAMREPHPTAAYAIVQALIARGVIGDYRAGDAQTPHILRFGFTPLYLGFEDVWNAVEHIVQVLDADEWQRPEFNQKNAVT